MNGVWGDGVITLPGVIIASLKFIESSSPTHWSPLFCSANTSGHSLCNLLWSILRSLVSSAFFYPSVGDGLLAPLLWLQRRRLTAYSMRLPITSATLLEREITRHRHCCRQKGASARRGCLILSEYGLVEVLLMIESTNSQP